MKLLRLLSVIVVFSTQSIRAQDNGAISLSQEFLEKYVYTFQVQEMPIEVRPPSPSARLGHTGGDDMVGRGTEFIIELPVT